MLVEKTIKSYTRKKSYKNRKLTDSIDDSDAHRKDLSDNYDKRGFENERLRETEDSPKLPEMLHTVMQEICSSKRVQPDRVLASLYKHLTCVGHDTKTKNGEPGVVAEKTKGLTAREVADIVIEKLSQIGNLRKHEAYPGILSAIENMLSIIRDDGTSNANYIIDLTSTEVTYKANQEVQRVKSKFGCWSSFKELSLSS
jgi:hypothetical protein